MGKSKKKTGKGTRIKKQNKTYTKLSRQGKLKMTRHKKKVSQKVIEPVEKVEDEFSESDHSEDFLDMIAEDDMDDLKKSVEEGGYSMFKNSAFKLKQSEEERNESMEEMYEREMDTGDQQIRHLLPIKADGTIIKRVITEQRNDDTSKDDLKKPEKQETAANKVEGKKEDWDIEIPKRDVSKPVSVADMLIWRQQITAKYKFKIGFLCSGLLEDPEGRIQNVKKLLDIYDEWYPELQITLKKLVIVSLMEVFKDILPSYLIKHQDEANVKLKKETKKVQMFEKSLLKGYRGYLMRLEKLCSRLYKKKGDTRVWTQQEIALGKLSITCLCELTSAHPYSNYSKHIVRLLTPFLDSNISSVRKEIHLAYKNIFAADKRGEITLFIVQRINELVKKKKHSVNADVISLLQYLNLEQINLDDIKEQEEKHKKALEKKKRLINLSKRERKRLKQLEKVEKELLETKGEENKQSRLALLTEVTKFVFTIYFRILKGAPKSGLLSVTLAGLAKFAPCINFDYYLDLVNVLDRLMKSNTLTIEEQLNCILTVFTILSGQGENLNIDPNNFYKHLYMNMVSVSAGENRKQCRLLVSCIEKIILDRKKNLTHERLIGFLKRIAIMCLQHEHHSCLAALSIIRQVLQNKRSCDILLDADPSIGQGIYLPELNDPEHCNASSTSLYELSLLQNHYHPVVQKMSQDVALGAPSSGSESGGLALEITKLNCLQLFDMYDSSGVVFNPPVPSTCKTNFKKVPPNQMCYQLIKKYEDEYSDQLSQELPILEEG